MTVNIRTATIIDGKEFNIELDFKITPKELELPQLPRIISDISINQNQNQNQSQHILPQYMSKNQPHSNYPFPSKHIKYPPDLEPHKKYPINLTRRRISPPRSPPLKPIHSPSYSPTPYPPPYNIGNIEENKYDSQQNDNKEGRLNLLGSNSESEITKSKDPYIERKKKPYNDTVKDLSKIIRSLYKVQKKVNTNITAIPKHVLYKMSKSLQEREEIEKILLNKIQRSIDELKHIEKTIKDFNNNINENSE